MADIPFFRNLKLKQFEFWKKSPEKILGLDFGSSSIKLIQLKKEHETAVLETYGEIALGPYDNKSVGQAVSFSKEKLESALTDLLKESDAKAKDAVISIPLRSSFVRVIEFPQMSEGELKVAVPFEARRYVPVPLTDVEMDWWEIPEALLPEKKTESEEETFKKRKTMSVLFVAIHKEIIENYRTLASDLGLEIRGFEIEVFSLARSSFYQELSPILLLDFGASSTRFTIMDYGIIRSTHQISQGSQNLSWALMRSLGSDFNLAEEMKRKIGLSDKPENQQAVSIINPFLEIILSEAKRMIADYRWRYKRSINHVFLAGGGSQLKGFANLATNSLGIETGQINPFQNVIYPAFLESVLKEIGPSFGIALGLAIRGLKEE